MADCRSLFYIFLNSQLLENLMSLNISGALAVICVGMSGVFMVGCGSSDKTSALVQTAAAKSLPTIEDYRVPQQADYNVDLKLSNESIDTALMLLNERPRVVFTVWGYDELAADVSATEIKVIDYEIRPQSVPYYVRFAESELRQIEYQSGSTDSLRYYITMAVDVDSDGQICNGDFRQDYTLSRPERFTVEQAALVREISLSEISGEICAE